MSTRVTSACAPLTRAGNPARSSGGMTRAGFAFAAMQWLAVAAFIGQIAIDASNTNLIAATLALAPATLTLQYLRVSKAFETTPLSAFAVLGLMVTVQWAALVALTFATTPVSDNLRDPIGTFGWLAFYQALTVFAHWLYSRTRAMTRIREAVAQGVLRPLGLFAVPSPGMLWLFGCLGFVAVFVSGAQLDSVEVGKKFLDGFRFLAWAPFAILVMHQRYGDSYCDIRKQRIGLAIYVLLAIGAGMAVNARSVMFSGLTTAGLLFLLLALGDRTRVAAKQLWRLVPVAILAILGVGYGADLATAMVIARSQRGNITPLEMVEQTFYALLDRRVIEAYEQYGLTAVKFDSYDEHYILNPIVARFVETKFHDNMLFLAKDLSPDDRKIIRQDTVDRILGILPEPVLRQLHVSAEKSALSYSTGDLLDFLRYGNQVGGFKKGSIFANFNAVFGPYAVPLYFGLCLILFLTWDSLSLPRRSKDDRVDIAPLAMLSTLSLFVAGIAMESVSNVLALLLRALPQSILFYALLFWIVRQVFEPYSRPALTAAPEAATR